MPTRRALSCCARPQALFDRPFIINRIAIRLADADQADNVADRLEARFGYKAQSWQARSADFLSLSS